METKIDESIIPLNFGWRAGIGTRIDDVVDSFERNRDYQIANGERLTIEQVNEYNQSIWYSLIADIEDALKEFIFERMCVVTYEAIKQKIFYILDTNIAKYPHIKGYSFTTYLNSLRGDIMYQMNMKLAECEPTNAIQLKCDGFLYVNEESNQIILNELEILEYFFN